MKQKLISGFLVASVLLSPALALASSASTVLSVPASTLSVDKSGNIKLVGTVSSVSGTAVMVSSWAGIWTVNTTSAKITRQKGGDSSIAEFQAGDTVTVTGTTVTAAPTITAKTVVNNSIQISGDVSPTGKISDVTDSGFNLTVGTKVYKVMITSTTEIIRDGSGTRASHLVPGVPVRVYGQQDRAETGITATRITQTTSASVSGAVSNVSTTLGSFTLTNSKQTVTVSVVNGTTLTLGGKSVNIAALGNNMTASVTGNWTVTDQALTATKVSAKLK